VSVSQLAVHGHLSVQTANTNIWILGEYYLILRYSETQVMAVKH